MCLQRQKAARKGARRPTNDSDSETEDPLETLDAWAPLPPPHEPPQSVPGQFPTDITLPAQQPRAAAGHPQANALPQEAAAAAGVPAASAAVAGGGGRQGRKKGKKQAQMVSAKLAPGLAMFLSSIARNDEQVTQPSASVVLAVAGTAREPVV